MPSKNRQHAYQGKHSVLLGQLQPASSTVSFTPMMSRGEQRVLTLLSAVVVVSGLAFIGWLLWPSDEPIGWTSIVVASLMVIIEGIRLSQSATLAIFARAAKDAVPQESAHGLNVALLTTMVPGKEPWDMISRTLAAMRQVTYPLGSVDVHLLDEGNDPLVQADCERMGVKHFSRAGIAEYNTDEGTFKRKTKHGNHNAWRDVNEDEYDIVGQMDPDHVPGSNFLERTLGYFNDPDVAYVVAPQVYGNLFSNWIAKGAAVLAYVFHGVIQPGGNALGAPLLIGTNHLYRVSAWKQIGGYADWKVEDHATAMVVLSEINPQTGNRWKGVYTKDILNIGEGPTTFFDWFQQQLRWSLGIWDIIFGLTPKILGKLNTKQKLSFLMLQSFYPTVAIGWVLSNILTLIFVATQHSTGKPIAVWIALWFLSMGSSLTLFFWLRRFNLVDHERNEWGISGLVLMLYSIPTYVVALALTVLRKQIPYGVTAKGKLAKRHGIKVFRAHIFWAACAVGLLVSSFVIGGPSAFPTLRFWLVFTLLVCLGPIVTHYAMSAKTARQARKISIKTKQAIGSMTAETIKEAPAINK